jgi:hypothetical protein
MRVNTVSADRRANKGVCRPCRPAGRGPGGALFKNGKARKSRSIRATALNWIRAFVAMASSLPPSPCSSRWRIASRAMNAATHVHGDSSFSSHQVVASCDTLRTHSFSPCVCSHSHSLAHDTSTPRSFCSFPWPVEYLVAVAAVLPVHAAFFFFLRGAVHAAYKLRLCDALRNIYPGTVNHAEIPRVCRPLTRRLVSVTILMHRNFMHSSLSLSPCN